MDLFIKDASEYKRDLRISHHYVEANATAIRLATNCSMEEAREFVKKTTGPGGKHELKDPKVKVLVRGKNGDRSLQYTTFNKFLGAVEKRNAILSPSLTAYLHPDEKISQYSVATDANIKARKVIKKEMFAAEAVHDKETAAMKDILQTGRKLTNNGMSGGFCTASTPFFCRSAHSSLTSCCRSATSSTNAFNEKYLAGNRHYHSPDIVIENISTIINNSDFVAIKEAMDYHNLKYPTVEQTMACIYRSTRRYWTDRKHMQYISCIVGNMSDLERAAFMFTSDMYHLREVNPEFVKQFLLELAERTLEPCLDDVVMSDGDSRVLATMKCADEIVVVGRELKANRKEGEKDVDPASTEQVKQLLKANYLLSQKNVMKYKPYIRAFLVTPNTPSSIAMMPFHVRETVLASDTDSSIFTEQEWIDWLEPNYENRQQRIQINAAVTFLVSQQVVHLLAIVSGNIGVPDEHLFRLTMKNEYFFESFVLTNMGKHYFATMAAREGNFYDEPKLELKGVHLRNSNVPKEIRTRGNKIINQILDKSNSNQQFSVTELLNQVGEIERYIYNSIRSGETVFLAKTTVKDKESYTKPLSNNYYYYLMWQEVFAQKYGDAPPLQYIGLKAKCGLTSKSAINDWLDELEDQALADRMRKFLTKYNKDKITQIVMPADIVMNTGVPSEIIEAINIRGLIMENIGMVYSCLESLGLYFVNPNSTRLVSDEH
ncbi:family B DNA polymerase [Proteus terrae]|uniref:family B DNA polymerase n=1 Tax=Proteus terrae TaxID=1574161 RepID=UPI0032D9B2C7